MAICRMAKTMIVCHRSEGRELLEALQSSGLCQILNAEEAMVTKEWPELVVAAEKPRQIEKTLAQLTQALAFLKDYAKTKKGLASALAPRTVIDEKTYHRLISDKKVIKTIEKAEQTQRTIETLKTEIENIKAVLEQLGPWSSLETAVEEISDLKTTVALMGLLAVGKFEQTTSDLAELEGVIEIVGKSNNNYACIVICLKEKQSEVQKLLRSADFESVSFEPMRGKVSDLIGQQLEKLHQAQEQLAIQNKTAYELAKHLLGIETLCDHYSNLLSREQTQSDAPATEKTVILEGWVREKDFSKVEKIVGGFSASSISRIKPAEGEEVPVEIENKSLIRPFEVVTRLYGMPQHLEVDPTIFLAPFFALFFALCLTDAGYGLIMIAATILFIKKMQGDTKLMWMLGICAAITVGAGAMTGGWFGDAVQQLNIGWLNTARTKMMWFDPLEKPMMFFGLSLALGYIQILAGLAIAFFHNIKQRDYIAAICDQLTWLVMLNSIVIYGASKGGVFPAEVGGFFGKLALVPAGAILLFSEREGGLGGRLGMGAYNLFSAIFYMGDVLSYLRLMALGMVTAGLGMAINVIAKIALDIPYIGFIVMIVVLIGGHGFNLAISGLSAFVHTLRLQYVEFFPKFLAGGGKLFKPLCKEYKHVYIRRV